MARRAVQGAEIRAVSFRPMRPERAADAQDDPETPGDRTQRRSPDVRIDLTRSCPGARVQWRVSPPVERTRVRTGPGCRCGRQRTGACPRSTVSCCSGIECPALWFSPCPGPAATMAMIAITTSNSIRVKAAAGASLSRRAGLSAQRVSGTPVFRWYCRCMLLIATHSPGAVLARLIHTLREEP